MRLRNNVLGMRMLISSVGLFCVLTLTPLLVAHASGGLRITEIMYDVPGSNAGREWVEIKNDSPEAIDLGAKTIRLTDVSGGHLIKQYQNEGTVLGAGDIAVIAQNPDAFLNDWPSYSALLLKSSFALPANSSGVVGISDGATTLAKATYTPTEGAHNDGNSLQLKGAKYVPAAPTPGTYPVVLPAALVATKLSPDHASSKGQAGHTSHSAKSTSKSKKTKKTTKAPTSYDKGITAPAMSAEADVAGAFPLSFAFLRPYKPVLTTVWFGWFLALLAFSVFSLIVLNIHGGESHTA